MTKFWKLNRGTRPLFLLLVMRYALVAAMSLGVNG
jgi:hypothetical protein